MLKKEFRETIRLSILMMIALLSIIFLYKLKIFSPILGFENSSGEMNPVKISDHFDVFIAASVITIVSGIFGLSLFGSEHKDNAFEYLFSAPISKFKIIFLKVITRLMALIPFFAVYVSIYISHTGNDLFVNSFGLKFLNPKFFISWAVFIFFISFFPSIFRQRNWIAITNLVTFITLFLLPVAIKKGLLISKFQFVNPGNIQVLSFGIGMLVVFIISGAAFFFAYKRFDLKEQSFIGKSYVTISLSPLLLLIGASIVVLLN